MSIEANIQKNTRNYIQKKSTSCFFLVLSIFFLECGTQDSGSSSISSESEGMQVRYFRTKELSSRNFFRYVSVNFSDEIVGTSIEQTHAIHELEKGLGTFYKVYYSPLGRILRYEFFHGKERKLSAQYLYRRAGPMRETSLFQLARIDYYDSDHQMIAWERIRYNSFGQPIQTERYTSQGRSHIY